MPESAQTLLPWLIISLLPKIHPYLAVWRPTESWLKCFPPVPDRCGMGQLNWQNSVGDSLVIQEEWGKLNIVACPMYSQYLDWQHCKSCTPGNQIRARLWCESEYTDLILFGDAGNVWWSASNTEWNTHTQKLGQPAQAQILWCKNTLHNIGSQ